MIHIHEAYKTPVTHKIEPLTPSLRHFSNKYKLAREGEKGKEKDEDLEIFFFMMKSSRVDF